MAEGVHRAEQPRAGEHGQVVSHTRVGWRDETPLPTTLAVAVKGRHGTGPGDQCRCGLDELVNVHELKEIANLLTEVPNLNEIILRRSQSLWLCVETYAVLIEEPRQVRRRDQDLTSTSPHRRGGVYQVGRYSRAPRVTGKSYFHALPLLR